MENQICIYTTELEHEAIIVRDKLEIEGIAAIILDKRDSSYNTFGSFEIHVNPSNQEKAKAIIAESNE